MQPYVITCISFRWQNNVHCILYSQVNHGLVASAATSSVLAGTEDASIALSITWFLLTVLCLAYHFLWFRPREQKKVQEVADSDSKQGIILYLWQYKFKSKEGIFPWSRRNITMITLLNQTLFKLYVNKSWYLGVIILLFNGTTSNIGVNIQMIEWLLLSCCILL